MLGRLPIRTRLTLAFTIATAVVLVATSAFLLLRLRASLDEAINDALAVRSRDVAALVERNGTLVRPGETDEGIAQVLRPDGTVAETSSLTQPLLTRTQVERATRRRITVERDDVSGLDTSVRLVAVPVAVGNESRVVVVGGTLDDRDDAVAALVRQLLVVSPIALLLASLGAYWLVGAALRPVDSMRSEAEAITGAEPGMRLSLPPARDEISRLGETLNEMLGRLESALEHERRFVADAGHELRTPLAALTTELELALRRPRSVDELEAALRSAAEEAERLSALADDLLLLAHADESGLPVRRVPVEAASLLDQVVSRFSGRARARGRSVAAEAGERIELRVDGVLVEQALGALVDNALGHGDGRVRLRAVVHDGRVELHVLDDGVGFPPAFLAHAFERFSRADDARARGGAGLGLAIAHAIASAHGGAAGARNRASGGADVWLALPLV